MYKSYRTRSLSNRMIAVFVLIVVFGIGGSTLILYSYFQNVIQQNTARIVDATVSTNSMMLSSVLQRIETSCDVLYQDDASGYFAFDADPPALIRMIVEYEPIPGNGNLGKLKEDYEANLVLFNNVFEDCFANVDNYSNVLFTSDDWPIHVFMPKRLSGMGAHGFSSSSRVEEQQWYQKAIALDGTPYWFSETGSTILQMAKLLKYRYVDENYRIAESMIGVVYVSFDVSDILQSLDLTELMPDSTMLLYAANELVYTPKSADDVSELLKLVGVETLDAEHTVSWRGNDHLITEVDLPLGLVMITAVPVTDIFSSAFYTVRIIIIVGIVTCGLVICFAVFMSRSIFKPLRVFAERMEQGNLADLVLDESRQDEIGVLHRSFNRLMANIEESRKKELEANERRRQYEVHALQMQINPHFLYNTLNSISCLALLNRQNRIVNLISCLTQIMRYNISDPEKMVQISEELFMIRQYAMIQQDCYRDRIAFEYHVAAEVEQLVIPKLIIQPLIENSVQYGISMGQEQILVRLSIFLRNEDLVIEVWDSGVNADIDMINRHVAGELKGKGDSLGIFNVYRRIHLMYGPAVSLIYSQDDAFHTVATMRIPRRLL